MKICFENKNLTITCNSLFRIAINPDCCQSISYRWSKIRVSKNEKQLFSFLETRISFLLQFKIINRVFTRVTFWLSNFGKYKMSKYIPKFRTQFLTRKAQNMFIASVCQSVRPSVCLSETKIWSFENKIWRWCRGGGPRSAPGP